MKLNKLSLRDKPLFNRYLNRLGRELAAFSFANIYIWSCLYDISWAQIEQFPCVFFRDSVGCFMFLPPLVENPSPEIIAKAFAVMDGFNKNKDISRIENIPQEQIEHYRALGYRCSEKYPDYLCLRSELALLKGNKFKSQRASCNYFIKHCDYDWCILKLADRQACLDLFDAWAGQRKAMSKDDLYCGMLSDSLKVLKSALANYKPLGLQGIAVRINKEIKAFSFGYRLNPETFCILYEITDLGIKGLAQFIFRRYCQELKNYKYINIMDDSGLENLRKTKLAYKPARLVPAFIATRT